MQMMCNVMLTCERDHVLLTAISCKQTVAVLKKHYVSRLFELGSKDTPTFQLARTDSQNDQKRSTRILFLRERFSPGNPCLAKHSSLRGR